MLWSASLSRIHSRRGIWCFPSDHKRDALFSVWLPVLLNTEDSVQAPEGRCGELEDYQNLTLLPGQTRPMWKARGVQCREESKWLTGSAERCRKQTSVSSQRPCWNPPLAWNGTQIKIQPPRGQPCLAWSLPTSPISSPPVYPHSRPRSPTSRLFRKGADLITDSGSRCLLFRPRGMLFSVILSPDRPLLIALSKVVHTRNLSSPDPPLPSVSHLHLISYVSFVCCFLPSPPSLQNASSVGTKILTNLLMHGSLWLQQLHIGKSGKGAIMRAK